MSDTLNWGILSTARINRRIIPPIKKAARSNIVAVASRKLTTAQEFAEKWDIPLTFGNYESLLAAPEVNAVYIPLPNSMHHHWTVAAAKAGKHVLCEKPLALSVAQVDEMMRVAQEHQVVFMEAVMYQTHPQLAKLKAVIDEGLIGPVKLIKSFFSFTMSGGPGNFRLDKDMGGGALWDVGSYPISLANSLAGGAPLEVVAYQENDVNGIDVIFAAQLRYANGIIAQIDCGFKLPYRVGAEVIGEKGQLRVVQPWQPDTDHRSSGLLHIAPDDTVTRIATEIIDPYLCEIQAMERAILDRAELPYPPARSRDAVATIVSLHRAAASGKIVPVER